MYQETLKKWHEMLEKQDPSTLSSILADEVVFFSPVVFTPQQGKKVTTMYLSGAFQVLVSGGNFKYIKETFSDKTAVLEFETLVDGVSVNGVDIITFNSEGLIEEFKVMVRPLQAMQKLQEQMARLLQKMKG